jgi:hypothetical protein
VCLTAVVISAAAAAAPAAAHPGQTVSEGGFAPNRVSAVSLLDIEESTDKKGHKYYKFELLARTGK